MRRRRKRYFVAVAFVCVLCLAAAILHLALEASAVQKSAKYAAVGQQHDGLPQRDGLPQHDELPAHKLPAHELPAHEQQQHELPQPVRLATCLTRNGWRSQKDVSKIAHNAENLRNTVSFHSTTSCTRPMHTEHERREQ